jgi:intergrase/recombinase
VAHISTAETRPLFHLSIFILHLPKFKIHYRRFDGVVNVPASKIQAITTWIYSKLVPSGAQVRVLQASFFLQMFEHNQMAGCGPNVELTLGQRALGGVENP